MQRYTTEVLDHADLDLAGRVLTSGRTAALLCVEATPAACHRSLVAMRLAKRHDVELLHLLPGRREATAVDPHRRNDP